MDKIETLNKIKSELYITEHFIKLFGIPRDGDICDMLLNLRCDISSLYKYEEINNITSKARISI